MSYIQCKDRAEVEKVKNEMKIETCFVTNDFRIYTEMEFWDDQIITSLNKESMHAVLVMQSHLEMLTSGSMEMPFQNIVEEAEELVAQFNASLKVIGYKGELKR